MSTNNIRAKLKPTHGLKSIIGIIGGHVHNTNAQALMIAEKAGEKLAQLIAEIIKLTEKNLIQE